MHDNVKWLPRDGFYNRLELTREGLLGKSSWDKNTFHLDIVCANSVSEEY